MENKKIELPELKKLSSHQLVQLHNALPEMKNSSEQFDDQFTMILSELESRGIDCSAIKPLSVEFLVTEVRPVFLINRKLYLQSDHEQETDVVLHFKRNFKRELRVQTHFVDYPQVVLSKLKGELPLLLIIRHGQLQTHIDASGLKGHLLAAFDHSDRFMAISVLNSEDEGTFGLLSQARTALIFRPDDLFEHKELMRISIEE